MELQLDRSDFDVVVIGTGLVESIVAAAAARAGQSVLQLDPCDHYGGGWASLRLEELRSLLTAADAPGSAAAAAGVRGAQLWERPGADLGPPRQYCLDLAPKASAVAYGAGPLIQLLLGSGAHHYLEFKLLQGSYLADACSGTTQLRSVPSSRSEVFKDRQLSPVQKRSLMRFLKAAAEALEGEGPLKDAFGAQPVEQLLKQQGLDEQLRQSLLHGLLLADDSCVAGGAAPPAQRRLTGAEALHRLRTFVQSVGRYGAGTGPFLTPMYGCGELPQAFSRVAAVAGAVQVLRCGVAGLSFDEHTFSCDGVELASGQAVRCRQLAANAAALEEWVATFHPPVAAGSTHRCCAVLDRPLVPGEQHSMVVVLPTTAGSVVRALALGSSTAVCPPGKHLVYLWVDAGSGDAGSSAAGSSSSSSTSGQPAAVEALLPALAALADTCALQPSSSSSNVDAAAGAAAGAAASEQDAGAGLAGSGGASSSKPTALWAAFYTQDTRQLLLQPGRGEAGGGVGRWPANVTLCPGPDSSATFVSAVEAAKQCYWRLFPAAEAAEGEAAAAAAEAAFPLDPGHPRAEPEGDDDDDNAAAAGAAVPAAGDADSDDEAVAALQAALRQLSTAEQQQRGGPEEQQ